MPKTYGMNYRGSKNRFCRDILAVLPKGSRLCDLFAGGGAISDYGIKNGLFPAYYIADKDKLQIQTVQKAMLGEYESMDCPWISREVFQQMKDHDGAVRSVFSFAGNLQDYCYSKEREPWMKALHYLMLYDDRTLYDALTPHQKERAVSDFDHHSGVPHLQRFERLKRMRIPNGFLHDITWACRSYEDYQYLPGDVVYCDIPYDTDTSQNAYGSFSRTSFWDWADSRSYPVFVSERLADVDLKHMNGRRIVWMKKTRGFYSASSNNQPITEILIQTGNNLRNDLYRDMPDVIPESTLEALL